MRGLVTTLIIAEVTGIATAALVVVIFDRNRSKYVMIAKKQKRPLIRIPVEQEKKISTD